MVLFCSWTNVVLSAIFVLEIGVRAEKRAHLTAASYSSSAGVQSGIGRRRRVKRVYNGLEIANDEYPYVVFLKSSLRDTKEECVEKLCTGTLVHRRFVITANICVNASAEFYWRKPGDIKIFLQTRPYDEITKSTTYNVGQRVNSNSLSLGVPDKVALILMNDTFPQVNYFPKIFNLNPVTENSSMECATVGFSLLGRSITDPIDEPVKPASYKFSAQFSVAGCAARNPKVDRSAYMCNVPTGGPLQKLLCEQGDEGSPLLCKAHANETDNRKVVTSTTSKSHFTKSQDDGMFLYGIANVVANMENCGPQGIGLAPVLFLYMLKYGAWVNEELAEFDESEGKPDTAEPDESGTVVTDWMSTVHTVLPEYYDTDDYDRAMKKPIRCKGRNRLAMNGYNSVSAG